MTRCPMNSAQVKLMKLLPDTQVFLWLRGEPQKVSSKALGVYQENNNIRYLSIVSVWEMQIRHQIGKADLNMPLQEIIEKQCGINSLKILPLRLNHIFRLQKLPLHHKAPFDRTEDIFETHHEKKIDTEKLVILK